MQKGGPKKYIMRALRRDHYDHPASLIISHPTMLLLSSHLIIPVVTSISPLPGLCSRSIPRCSLPSLPVYIPKAYFADLSLPVPSPIGGTTNLPTRSALVFRSQSAGSVSSGLWYMKLSRSANVWILCGRYRFRVGQTRRNDAA